MTTDFLNTAFPPAIPPRPKRLNVFERYLSLWVVLCMVAGVALGRLAPQLVATLRRLEFGSGSQINAPIAVLIWLMIVPMMLKIDFTSMARVGRKPTGLFVTLFVNWLVKPFCMAFFGWLFFEHLFLPLHRAGAGRPVHGGRHHPGRGPLHRDGLRLELPLGRRPRLHARPGLGERPHHAGRSSRRSCGSS